MKVCINKSSKNLSSPFTKKVKSRWDGRSGTIQLREEYSGPPETSDRSEVHGVVGYILFSDKVGT